MCEFAYRSLNVERKVRQVYSPIRPSAESHSAERLLTIGSNVQDYRATLRMNLVRGLLEIKGLPIMFAAQVM